MNSSAQMARCIIKRQSIGCDKWRVGGWYSGGKFYYEILPTVRFCERSFFMRTWDELSNRRAASIIFNQLLGYTFAVHDEVVLENLINPSGCDPIHQGFLQTLRGQQHWTASGMCDSESSFFQWWKLSGLICPFLDESLIPSLLVYPPKALEGYGHCPLNGVLNMAIEAYVAIPCRKYSMGIGWHNKKQQKSLFIHAVDFCRIA